VAVVDFTGVTVTGTYTELDGSPAIGNVTFAAQVTGALLDSTADIIVLPDDLTITLDANGSLSVILLATDDPSVSPQGFTYLVTEHIGRAMRSYSIPVPLGPPLDLRSVAPVAPVIQGPLTIVTSVNGVRPDINGNVTIDALGGHGSAWFVDDGAPGDVTGADPGDYYLDWVTGAIYQLS
jgi:hypothetical protein